MCLLLIYRSFKTGHNLQKKQKENDDTYLPIPIYLFSMMFCQRKSYRQSILQNRCEVSITRIMQYLPMHHWMPCISFLSKIKVIGSIIFVGLP